MADERPLSLPVILGTTRQGRMSENAARFVHGELSKRQGVSTEIIDIARLGFRIDDAGEGVAGAEFTEKMNMADGLIIVSPEYNHSFPGLLKHVLDSCLEEYIHKPAAIVGVSAGSFGGARGIQNLLPVLRELGLTATFTDLYFGSVAKIFDMTGRLLEPAFVERTANFLDELIWMATTFRYGRENVPLE